MCTLYFCSREVQSIYKKLYILFTGCISSWVRMRRKSSLPLAASGVDSSGGNKRIPPWILKVQFVPTLMRSRRLILVLIIAAYRPLAIYLRYLQSPECPLDSPLILGCDRNLFHLHSWIWHSHLQGGISHRHVALKVFCCFTPRCRVSNRLHASSLCLLLVNKPPPLPHCHTHFWICRHSSKPPVVIFLFLCSKAFRWMQILCYSVETTGLLTHQVSGN